MEQTPMEPQATESTAEKQPDVLTLDLVPYAMENLTRFYRNHEATDLAYRLCNKIERDADRFEPYAIGALTRHFFPDDGETEAMTKFCKAASELSDELIRFGASERDRMKAEKQRLNPVISIACRRRMSIDTEISDIPKKIKASEAEMQRRRDVLASVGVTGDDLERLAPFPDNSGLLAEREEVEAEDKIISAFFATFDERVFPPGYTEKHAIKEWRSQNPLPAIP